MIILFYYSGLINNISAAITSADWTPVGAAIGEGISKALSGGEKEATGEGIGELTVKPTSLNVDLTDAEIKTTGLSENGSLPLPDGTIGAVSGTASEIQIDGDYTPVIPEEGITLTYDTVSGETTTIKITPTNYSDDSQTSEVKIDGTYSSVKGKADSATIDITTYTVDITDVVCPMTFVKAKVAMEEIEVGQILAVTMNDGEPVQNVPRSFKEEGQQILKLIDNENGTYDLIVKKVEE